MCYTENCSYATCALATFKVTKFLRLLVLLQLQVTKTRHQVTSHTHATRDSALSPFWKLNLWPTHTHTTTTSCCLDSLHISHIWHVRQSFLLGPLYAKPTRRTRKPLASQGTFPISSERTSLSRGFCSWLMWLRFFMPKVQSNF